MLRMDVSTFVADWSAIEFLIERYYPPSGEEVDGGRTFGTRGELLALVWDAVRGAIEGKAADVDFELLDHHAWVRIDFPDETRHEVFRHRGPCAAVSAALQPKPMRLACATAR
jgi:hypothetical protein